MQFTALKKFACPVDDLPLQRTGDFLRCEKGHSFDFAKAGYCNLLLVQKKATSNPGDNKEMVAARRRFLDSGYYAPIAEQVFSFICAEANLEKLRIVDAGCGEGYYLDYLSKQAMHNSQLTTLELAGIDISKYAIQAAAKRNKNIAWLVASNRKLPFSADSIDFILSMFGYPIWESFKTVQPKHGKVLLVEPGADHLIELRNIIYPKVEKNAAPPLTSAEAAGFHLESEKFLCFKIDLKNQIEIQDLLAMTPHAYRISADGAARLNYFNHLSLTVDIHFRLLSP